MGTKVADLIAKYSSQVQLEEYAKRNGYKEFVADFTAQKAEFATLKDAVYQGQNKKVKVAKTNPTIVCYGDSNTRFYEGDNNNNGSISFAFSAYIDRACSKYPELYNSVVINAGYPAQMVQYAITNYATNITANSPNIVVIGFGTNDIKTESQTLEAYISSMETLITMLRNDGIEPIVLGIPYFDVEYAGAEMQARIPVWNDSLFTLCYSYGVEFIDVYSMFPEEEKSVWFNEVTTPKRHFSKYATQMLGYEIMERIKKITRVFKESGFINEVFSTRKTGEMFSSISGILSYLKYELDEIDNINTIQLPTGASITFKSGGNFCLSFYPRAAATLQITVDGVAHTFTITSPTDGGIYYPIKRFSTSDFVADYGSEVVVTISVTSGNAYLRGVSCRLIPTLNPSSSDTEVTKQLCKVTNSANLPIPASTVTVLTFDTEIEDNDNIHSVASNTSRLTCTADGTYLIGGGVIWAASATGIRVLRIRKNGTDFLIGSNAGGNTEEQNISIIENLVAGDYIEMTAYQTTTGALNILKEKYSPTLYMTRLS